MGRQQIRVVTQSPQDNYTNFSKGMEFNSHAKDTSNPRVNLIKNLNIDSDGKLSLRNPVVPFFDKNGNYLAPLFKKQYEVIQTFFYPGLRNESRFIWLIKELTSGTDIIPNYRFATSKHDSPSTAVLSPVLNISRLGIPTSRLDSTYLAYADALYIKFKHAIVRVKLNSQFGIDYTILDEYQPESEELVSVGINLFNRNPFDIHDKLVSGATSSISTFLWYLENKKGERVPATSIKETDTLFLRARVEVSAETVSEELRNLGTKAVNDLAIFTPEYCSKLKSGTSAGSTELTDLEHYDLLAANLPVFTWSRRLATTSSTAQFAVIKRGFMPLSVLPFNMNESMFTSQINGIANTSAFSKLKSSWVDSLQSFIRVPNGTPEGTEYKLEVSFTDSYKRSFKYLDMKQRPDLVKSISIDGIEFSMLGSSSAPANPPANTPNVTIAKWINPPSTAELKESLIRGSGKSLLLSNFEDSRLRGAQQTNTASTTYHEIGIEFNGAHDVRGVKLFKHDVDDDGLQGRFYYGYNFTRSTSGHTFDFIRSITKDVHYPNDLKYTPAMQNVIGLYEIMPSFIQPKTTESSSVIETGVTYNQVYTHTSLFTPYLEATLSDGSIIKPYTSIYWDGTNGNRRQQITQLDNFSKVTDVKALSDDLGELVVKKDVYVVAYGSPLGGTSGNGSWQQIDDWNGRDWHKFDVAPAINMRGWSTNSGENDQRSMYRDFDWLTAIRDQYSLNEYRLEAITFNSFGFWSGAAGLAESYSPYDTKDTISDPHIPLWQVPVSTGVTLSSRDVSVSLSGSSRDVSLPEAKFADEIYLSTGNPQKGDQYQTISSLKIRIPLAIQLNSSSAKGFEFATLLLSGIQFHIPSADTPPSFELEGALVKYTPGVERPLDYKWNLQDANYLFSYWEKLGLYGFDLTQDNQPYNYVMLSQPDNTSYFPNTSILDVYSYDKHLVTTALPWRNNLLVFTDSSTTMFIGSEGSTKEVISTNVGISKENRRTAQVVSTSVVFKYNQDVIALVPAPGTDNASSLNTRIISKQIEDYIKILDDSNPISLFSTTYKHEYWLAYQFDAKTVILKYSWDNFAWTVCEYDYSFNDLFAIESDKVIASDTAGHVYNLTSNLYEKEVAEIVSLLHTEDPTAYPTGTLQDVLGVSQDVFISIEDSNTITDSSLAELSNYTKRISVDHVYDGDTFTTTDGTRYRLLGVDTPEEHTEILLRQEWADKAKQFVESKLMGNPEVYVLETGASSFDRKVASVAYKDSSSANPTELKVLSVELVKAGLARVAYISSDQNDKYYYPGRWLISALSEAEASAISGSVGFHALPEDVLNTIIYSRSNTELNPDVTAIWKLALKPIDYEFELGARRPALDVDIITDDVTVLIGNATSTPILGQKFEVYTDGFKLFDYSVDVDASVSVDASYSPRPAWGFGFSRYDRPTPTKHTKKIRKSITILDIHINGTTSNKLFIDGIQFRYRQSGRKSR